jgi:DNA-binding transcriptional LysR family regulator
MEDHRLRAFCLIVELKSFSKAAGAKFMTQSAMSHLIRNLEDEMGIRLLNRHAKSVTPTSAGRLFYAHAKRILDGYRTMESELHRLTGTPKGLLCLGASATVTTYLLPELLYDFSKHCPQVHLSLSVANTEKVIDDLTSGRIDLGIVEGSLKQGEFLSEKIASDELVVIASENHPLAKKRSVTARDMAAHSFIMPESGSGTRECIDEFLSAMKIDPRNMKVAMTLGSPELVVQMVQAGVGVSLVSKWSVFRAVKEGTVAVLSIPGAKFMRPVYLIALDEASLTMAGKEFKRFASDYRFFVPF